MSVNSVVCETLPNSADWDFFQDSDFAGDFEDSMSSGAHPVHFRASNFRASQLDVHEANCGPTQ